jgi:CRP-like cAMP-binding protein
MNDLYEKLVFCELFSKKNIEEIKEDIELTPEISDFRKGEVIHLTGEECDRVEVIISGNASVQSLSEQGQVLTVNDLKVGSIIGASLIFSKDPIYPMSVFAKTNVTFLNFNKKQILKMCKSSSFLEKYLSILADKATILTGRIKILKQKSLREQIINYLKAQYELQNSLMIVLPTTKKDLANRFGVRRTSLSRELLKMKRSGLVDYDKDHIIIKDKKIVSD